MPKGSVFTSLQTADIQLCTMVCCQRFFMQTLIALIALALYILYSKSGCLPWSLKIPINCRTEATVSLFQKPIMILNIIAEPLRSNLLSEDMMKEVLSQFCWCTATL